MRLQDAPQDVRAFGMKCWTWLSAQLFGSKLIPFWEFLEIAMYNPDTREVVFGVYTWPMPAKDNKDD